MSTVRSDDSPLPCVTRASANDIPAIAALFDAYRVFYRQPSDPAGAHAFVAARFERTQSILFLARSTPQGQALGFTQLYPSFSSVAMRRIWILNDLFVSPDARKRGVAHALMEKARKFAQADGAARMVLETGADNHAAQALYESLGYRCEHGTRHCCLSLDT